jgi:hypothetical protein
MSHWHDIAPWGFICFEYCDWETRTTLTKITKGWFHRSKSDSFYRFLCGLLESQHGLYVPPYKQKNSTWQSLFRELVIIRNLWLGLPTPSLSALEHANQKFKINVYARFRPFDASGVDENAESGMTAKIPLHHRLAMIRMSNGFKSNRQALKLLTQSGGWFQNKWLSIANEAQEPENVFWTEKQYKPTFKVNTKVERMVSKVEAIDSENGRVVMLAPSVGLREFSFNHVFSPNSTQSEVYEATTRRLVTDFLNGYNATAIVYGQTGRYQSFNEDDLHLSLAF